MKKLEHSRKFGFNVRRNRLAAFLKAYKETGHFPEARRQAGIGHGTIYYWYHHEPVFAFALEEVQRQILAQGARRHYPFIAEQVKQLAEQGVTKNDMPPLIGVSRRTMFRALAQKVRI